MKESTYENKVVKFLANDGWVGYKMAGVKRGLPDRLFIRGKDCFWAEFKVARNKASSAQKAQIKKLSEQANEVFIFTLLHDGQTHWQHFSGGQLHKMGDVKLEDEELNHVVNEYVST